MKKELKGFITGVAVCCALGAVSAGAAGLWKNIPVLENDISVVVYGTKLTSDNFLYQDKTYLPLREAAEALGEPVTYDGDTNTAYFGRVPDQETALAGVYYSEDPWALDFGHYQGHTLLKTEATLNETKGHQYIYEKEGGEQNRTPYYSRLEKLGFRTLRVDWNYDLFLRGNQVISVVDDEDASQVIVSAFTY